jgi:hypothetical protein
MFILINKLNNILKFTMLKLDLWLFYIFCNKDHKMYIWSCFYLGGIFNLLTFYISWIWFTMTFSCICFLNKICFIQQELQTSCLITRFLIMNNLKLNLSLTNLTFEHVWHVTCPITIFPILVEMCNPHATCVSNVVTWSFNHPLVWN